ncbi:MAG TPA: MotA/TolQ/ExbB proton channel family protein [Phycisphaerae bacterium]|nr:MotA/TolQ/ExbB proton channel family protein [Phycisphaerae bacterium]HRY69307.1 MotA/TolQ/ExbB proton channel family protein [Phycisphaerae bacterium]HSA26625.1 MotA/TolQ/ExbB proton channel family protein [Phycisphaerae bacterium]
MLGSTVMLQGIMLGQDTRPVSLFKHFVIDGGPITWCVLIPLSVITVTLIINYAFTIRRGTQAPASLARALAAAARQGQSRGILEITREETNMLGQAVYAGVSQIGSGFEVAMGAVVETVDEQVGRLLRRIEYLSVIGNVAPMIGLLGTVVGMIQAFNRIFAAGGGVPEASKLVGDIAIALVNTFWGLFVAIPALSAFAFLRNRIDAYGAECVKLCDQLVATVIQTEGRAAPDALRGQEDTPRVRGAL